MTDPGIDPRTHAYALGSCDGRHAERIFYLMNHGKGSLLNYRDFLGRGRQDYGEELARLRQAILAAVRGDRSSAWKKMDRAGNGTLSLAELQGALLDLGIHWRNLSSTTTLREVFRDWLSDVFSPVVQGWQHLQQVLI